MFKVAVCIPIYTDKLSNNEIISLNQIFKIFINRDIYLVGPESILKKFKTSINSQNVSIVSFEKQYFKSIYGYNRLLMSKKFYKRFSLYDYLLICQLDVYVFEDRLDYWVNKNYDFIGAPILSNLNFNFKESQLLNGGFSLRKIKSHINVLDNILFRYYTIKKLASLHIDSIFKKFLRILRDGIIFNYNIKNLTPIINEDVYWTYLIDSNTFKICNRREAINFAIEKYPRKLFEYLDGEVPMAVHAWWKYDKEYITNVIEDYENKDTK